MRFLLPFFLKKKIREKGGEMSWCEGLVFLICVWRFTREPRIFLVKRNSARFLNFELKGCSRFWMFLKHFSWWIFSSKLIVVRDIFIHFLCSRLMWNKVCGLICEIRGCSWSSFLKENFCMLLLLKRPQWEAIIVIWSVRSKERQLLCKISEI